MGLAGAVEPDTEMNPGSALNRDFPFGLMVRVVFGVSRGERVEICSVLVRESRSWWLGAPLSPRFRRSCPTRDQNATRSSAQGDTTTTVSGAVYWG